VSDGAREVALWAIFPDCPSFQVFETVWRGEVLLSVWVERYRM